MDKTKRLSKAHVSNIYFSKQNICASRRETIPLCKSKTSLGKANIIFSDIIFGDGLQEGLTRLCLSRAVGKTGFQLVMTLPQLFFLFVARVSGVTLLAGPVAIKKKL